MRLRTQCPQQVLFSIKRPDGSRIHQTLYQCIKLVGHEDNCEFDFVDFLCVHKDDPLTVGAG